MNQDAYIWDLDGTLLDSYAVIVEALSETLKAYGFPMKQEEINRIIITSSVNALLEELIRGSLISFKEIKEHYSDLSEKKALEIKAIPHAEETLKKLKEKGALHFVFTHRGESSEPVLEKNGLLPYFDEIITAKSGFNRKPDPQALLHLMEKHRLDPTRTFYVGDRTIDMDCAKNAKIRGILYLPPTSYSKANGSEYRIIDDLRELYQNT